MREDGLDVFLSEWSAGPAAKDGYTMIGGANHPRSVKADADSVARVIRSVAGDVILVGHSYGGSVISAAAQERANVK